jgi:proteasome-associated ATPase
MSYLDEKNQVLRKALEDAKKKLKEQDSILQQLVMAATTRGVVVSIAQDKALLSYPKGLVEVALPMKKVNGKDLSRVSQGDGVRILDTAEMPPSIVDILSLDDWTGDIAFAVKAGKGGEVEVEWQGNGRIARYSNKIKAPEPGDRLMMDGGGQVAIRNLGPDESHFQFNGTTGVTWDDIGGLQDAKEALIEAVELPHRYAELYRNYNKKGTKGVLLYGPPGCGKTMLAKAAATSVATSLGKKQVDTGFIYVKGPEILNSYVGNTEATIRSLFARARKHKKLHGYPAVILLDEADAILGKRGSHANTGMEHTVVPQFLSEMDGLDDSAAIMLLATNRPDTLDSAVTRDQRVDRKIRVGRPNQSGAEEILKLNLRDCPLVKGLSADDASAQAAASLYNTDLKYYNLVGAKGSVAFTLAGLVNGAMIAGLVDKATTTAMRRDITNGGKAKGVTIQDLEAAVKLTYRENKDLNHEMEVQEFAEERGLSMDQIIRAEVA